MQRYILLILLCLVNSVIYAQSRQMVFIKTKKIETPFGKVSILSPDFSKCPQFDITDFGAVTGNKLKTSKAISEAIQKANEVQGGVVVIPAGEWLTGKIHLKSNVSIHLDSGAILLFSDDPEDYLPAVKTTWEGMECMNYSPLIYAFGCKNISLTGQGELKAKMDHWKKWFSRPKGHMESLKRLYNFAADYTPVEQRVMVNDSANLRPQFIQFNRCENVLVEGIKITNSPFWTVHPYLSKNVTIRQINVYAHGHNNDGIDPEMSQNVLVEDCILDQGDDAIAIKSGRNPEGWRLKTPSKNIIIRNCTVKNGHQLVAIGSELSGGIENISIENCKVLAGAKLNHLIFIKTNERMGGYVKNVYAKNIIADKIALGVLGIETNVLYQWKNLVPTKIVKLTPIGNVFLAKIVAKEAEFISRILGDNRLPIKKVTLRNVEVTKILKSKHIHANLIGFGTD